MVIINETSLLNTYYYLKPFEVPTYLDTQYKTIHPNIFKNLTKISENPRLIYNTNFYLYNVKITPIKSNIYTPLNQVLLVENYTMIDSLYTKTLYEWLDEYIDVPFMVTNPCYKIKGELKRYFFSNKYACSLSIFGRENYLYGAIANDGYSIGNGLTIALSMVALGLWKEIHLQTYLSITNIGCEKSTWDKYTQMHSVYIMNNPFIYAHQFNTSRIYTYIAVQCKSNHIICHISPYYTDIYITNTIIDIKTMYQYFYANNCIDIFEYYRKLIYLFEEPIYLHTNFTQIIKSILDNKQLYSLFLKDDQMINNIKKYIALNEHDAYRIIIETFIHLERIYPQKKFYNVYLKFSKTFSEGIIKELYRTLVHIHIGDMRLPYPSEKFMRKTIYHNPAFNYYKEFKFTTYKYFTTRIPFEYNVIGTGIKYITMFNASWKKLLTKLKYKNTALKIMYKKLLLLKRKTSSHQEGALVYFLVTEYIRDNMDVLI